MMFERRGKTFLIIGILLVISIGSAVVFFFLSALDLDKVRKDVQAKVAEVIPSEPIVSAQIMPDFSVYRDDLLKNSQDFLEINLQQKQVSFYQQGQVVKTAEILKLGDKVNWGGTPAGLYSVLSGGKEAYSAGAEAYMPYALKFYGKYFLHGSPYYANGDVYASDFSGGCVQIADQDAKEFFDLTKINLPVLVIDQQNTECPVAVLSDKPLPQIQAVNYLIADLDCGEVLAQKNAQEKIAVGSLLDFLEAIVIAENIDLRDDLGVSAKAEQMSCGASDVLQAGGYYRAVDLFYPLLSENSAKANWVLAAFLGRQRMPQLMQEKAKAMMMTTTTVSDIFSCDGEGNISTAQDLFYLARYLQNTRPPLLAISRKDKVRTFGALPFDLASLSNQNISADDETFVGGRVSVVNGSQYNGLFIFKNISIILLKEDSLESLQKDALQIKAWLGLP
ncbi:MAG: L,D-transpeptidase family protein [Patescibacteria group bacterium]